MTKTCLWGLIGWLAFARLVPSIAAQSSHPDAGPVKTCGALSLSMPGSGVAYRGVVQNDDYQLRVEIPRGLTGWGAARVAPFHGFMIPLGNGQPAPGCIVFEIHLRIDLDDTAEQPAEPSPGKPTEVGNVKGFREEGGGEVRGVGMHNVHISFSVPRDGEVADGSVWLVSRTADLQGNQDLFQKFLSSIRFGRAGRSSP